MDLLLYKEENSRKLPRIHHTKPKKKKKELNTYSYTDKGQVQRHGKALMFTIRYLPTPKIEVEKLIENFHLPNTFLKKGSITWNQRNLKKKAKSLPSTTYNLVQRKLHYSFFLRSFNNFRGYLTTPYIKVWNVNKDYQYKEKEIVNFN